MALFEQIERANANYVRSGRHVPRPVEPAKKLAVVTCMDSRIDVFSSLGLQIGDAHVIRTAGARVTDDVLRSLALSTHVLGTRTCMVLGHTRCGLLDNDGNLAERLDQLPGVAPPVGGWGAFADPLDAIRDDCARLAAWPGRPADFEIGGYLVDVDTGQLTVASARHRPDDPTYDDRD